MDLLGSILNAMDKPPAANEKEKEAIKKQREQLQKMQRFQKDDLLRFRKFAEERLDRLGRDPKRTSMQFQPLQKVYRSVVHEIAEIAGLIALSYGEEGVDRYIVVYKRDNPPSDDEVAARRDGSEWNESIASEYRANREKEALIEQEKAIKSAVVEPTSNYKDKYVHLIGQEAALEAARKTETNKSYGFVPSENKKDVRSIEQTLADIQAKKRQKLVHNGPLELSAEPELSAVQSTSSQSSLVEAPANRSDAVPVESTTSSIEEA